MKTNDQLQLQIDRARWFCLQSLSFYGNLCMGLKDVIGSFPGINTAATDGKRIFWDASFLAKLTDEETRFVLIHETKHPAQQHLWRLPMTELGNIAGDYEINLELSKIPGIKMPAGGLLSSQWEGKACEEIYAALNKQPKQPQPKQGSKPGSGGNDPGKCGGFMAPAPDEAKPGNGKPGAGKIGAQTLKEEWEQRVIQASQAAKASGQGTIPGDMERLLNRISRTDIDWRQELADFTKSVVGARNDWSRSSRRMATQPVIYPRRKVSETGLILAFRDTSGSITDDLCSEFTALIAGAASEMNATVILVDCDTQIQAEHRLEPGSDFPLQAVGGGGSDFRCVQTRAQQLIDEGENVSGIIVCTDLEISEPDDVPAPILWLSTTDRIAKTGRTVRIL